MNWDYLICWIVVFGLSYSFASTDGPFDLFRKVRHFISNRFDSFHWIYNGIHCPICVSFWVGAVTSVFYCDWSLREWISLWLSSFGFVSLVICLSPPGGD